MSKFTLPVTLACLLAVVALARGDEPTAVPVESKPGDAALAATPPADPATSQPESAGPRVISIETTPDLERSEVIGKLIERLEKDGIAKRSVEDSEGKPVDFHAVIVVQADMPGEKIRKLIETLKAVSIERASIQLGPADGVSEVIVTCPADVTFQRVRTLHESLVKQVDFKIDVRVAGNDGPVTSTGPTMFTRSLQPLASPVDGGVSAGDFGGAGIVAMGLPASAIPGRKWVAGTKVIVALLGRWEDRCSLTANNILGGYLKSWNRFRGPRRCRLSVLNRWLFAMEIIVTHTVTTLGTWDVLNLPPGEVAIPAGK